MFQRQFSPSGINSNSIGAMSGDTGLSSMADASTILQCRRVCFEESHVDVSLSLLRPGATEAVISGLAAGSVGDFATRKRQVTRHRPCKSAVTQRVTVTGSKPVKQLKSVLCFAVWFLHHACAREAIASHGKSLTFAFWLVNWMRGARGIAVHRGAAPVRSPPANGSSWLDVLLGNQFLHAASSRAGVSSQPLHPKLDGISPSGATFRCGTGLLQWGSVSQQDGWLGSALLRPHRTARQRLLISVRLMVVSFCSPLFCAGSLVLPARGFFTTPFHSFPLPPSPPST